MINLSRIHIAALLGAALVIAGCRGPGTRDQADPAARALAAAREACGAANIVIVCLDAVRRDHVGAYGYARPTTPEFDRLAAEAVRFTHAVTDATYTLGAVGSLWSGQYPDTHGASVAGMRLPLDLTTLPEAARAAGMRTAVLSSSGIIIPAHGFADGVDDFVRVYTGDPSEGRTPELQREWRAWLDGIGARRFFLYLHIMQPHHPYEVSGPFRGTFDPDYRGSLEPTQTLLPKLDDGRAQVSAREREHIIAMYDEALRYADSALGTLIQDLRQRDLLDNSIVIAYSDHGEAFGEHGRWLHANTVYRELTHIPLVMRLPAGVEGAQPLVEGLAQLSDIAPTLASLAGLEMPSDQVQGHDLAPEIFGAPPARHAAFSRSLAEPDLLRAVEIEGAKGIFNGDGKLIELYDLQADPAERHNLAGKHSALADRILPVWSAWARQQKYIRPDAAAPPPRRHQLDPETEKWLRSLGYL